MNSKSIKGVVFLIIASIIWGSSFVVVKDSLDYVSVLWQLFYRLFVASIGGAVIFISQIKFLNKKYIFQGIILGIFFALAIIPQNFGASFTTASKCAFLTVSYVAFTPVISAIFLKNKLTPKKIITVVICMMGVGFITLKDGFNIEIGDIFLIVTGIFYAVHLLWIDYIGNSEGAVVIHILQIWTATIIVLITALILEPVNISLNKYFIFGIAYCGIFEILIGFLLQLKGQQNTSPTLAGIILSSECVFAAIFGVLFQGDSFSIKMTIGCVLIFLSAVIESLNFERSDKNGYKTKLYRWKLGCSLNRK
ncbi:MAG: DMT family transporter [Lachnospirales bacterium]